MAEIVKFPSLKVKAKAAVDRAVTTTKVKTQAVVSEIKTWGIGEWGSVASMLGIGLWVWDKRKRDKQLPK